MSVGPKLNDDLMKKVIKKQPKSGRINISNTFNQEPMTLAINFLPIKKKGL
jgi:hypothetical protein